MAMVIFFYHLGINGHLVSNYISVNIGKVFTESIDKCTKKYKEAWFNTYQKLFEELVIGPIDVTFSGTTAVTCFLIKDYIYTINSGDSRAIVGTK